MTDDFALIDFALAARSPQDIAQAIGRALALRRKAAATAGTAMPAGGGFLSRMFRRGANGAAGGPLLLIQPDGTLDPAPLTRAMLTDSAAGQLDAPVRLTGPVGLGGLTLIEFLEGDAATSVFCEGLSAELPGEDIFYFRHSGSLHPGAHFAFHIYRDGRVTRRAESISTAGTAPESNWAGIDSGMPHPLETDSLAPPGLPTFEIMTPARQASILEALGLDPGTLFEDRDADAVVLELSPHPGGAPLAEAAAIVGHLKKRRSGPMLKQVPPVTAPADAPVERGAHAAEPSASDQGSPNAAEAAAAAFTADKPPPFELQADARVPAESAAKPASPSASTGSDPRGPARRGDRDLSLPPWEDQRPAPSWEEEVTTILLEAVESALPPAEQAAWLERLTGHLTAGDLDTALSETLRVIAAGNRPPARRDAAAKRLTELFGRDA
jgi:hypothetical protein